jgi:hypothetical protein
MSSANLMRLRLRGKKILAMLASGVLFTNFIRQALIPSAFGELPSGYLLPCNTEQTI